MLVPGDIHWLALRPFGLPNELASEMVVETHVVVLVHTKSVARLKFAATYQVQKEHPRS